MSWNAWIRRRYAAGNGYPLGDFHAVTEDATTGDCKDGLVSPTVTDVHPSEAGAKVMAQATFDAMLSLLRPSAPPLAASQVDTVIFSSALLSATAHICRSTEPSRAPGK